METINKSSVQGMAMAAVVALALTWSMSYAFVESTSVARWVTAADVAGGVVARVAEAGPVKGAAASLLK
jgi:uncharacterized membrane protein